MKKQKKKLPQSAALIRPDPIDEDDASSASSVAPSSPPMEEVLPISGNCFTSPHNTLPRLYGMEYSFKQMVVPPQQQYLYYLT